MIMTSKGEKTNMVLSVVSLFSLIAALILSYYKTELFGIIKGYAPHNYSFNLTYFIPLILLSIVTAFVSLIWLRNNWKLRQNIKLKWITMLLSLPAIGIILLLMINIFRMFY